MADPAVIVYGTVCLDQFVLPGHQEIVRIPGGEGFNTATALAGWNVPVYLTGTAIGDDPEGLWLRAALSSHPLATRIDCSLLPFCSGSVTPVCTIKVSESGDRTMSGKGFQQAIAPDLKTLRPLLQQHGVFTVDPNLGEPAIGATLAAVHSGWTVVSMDCIGMNRILAASEIAVTSREWIDRFQYASTPEAATLRMIDAGAKVSIVTTGQNGGTYRIRDETEPFYFSSETPDAPVIDTTGAGDTFRAGLCYGLLNPTGFGNNSQERMSGIVRFAARAAAIHCTKIGGGTRSALTEVLNQSVTS